MKKPAAFWLMIGIPVAAIIMSSISVFVALSNPDPGVELDGRPLSKTSYQAVEQ